MFAKTLLAAAASAILFTGLAQNQAFAFEGGGGGEAFHLRTAPVPQRNTGRIQWRTNANGTVEAVDTQAPKKPAKVKPPKPRRIKWRTLPNGTIEAEDVGAGAPPAPRRGDFAESHDRNTGQRTGSYQTGGGRLVISIGPLGLSIGPSMW